jgi:hypothetical protein
VFFSDAIDARLDFIRGFGVAPYWSIDAKRRFFVAVVAPNVAMRRWSLMERRIVLAIIPSKSSLF